MSSRASHSLLVAALAFLALPSYGTAQAPRRPAPADSPYRAATRAFNEGRYDDVDAIPDKADPNIVAVKGRAAIARGHYAEAESQLRAVATRVPSSEAALELGLLEQMLGRPDAVALLEKVAPLADTSNDPVEVARAARALRALGRFHESNAAYRDAAGAAPNDPAIHTALGDLFLEKYDNAEALKSYQMALQVDPRWTAALIGSARALADENPPQAAALAKRALEVNPSSVEAQVFLAGEAADAGQHDEARQALDKALAVNPSSLEAHRPARRVVVRRGQAAGVRSGSRQGAGHRPAVRRGVPRGRGSRRPQLPVRRSGRARTPERWRSMPAARTPRPISASHLLRTGDEAGARTALEASFKADPFNNSSYNLLTVMDKLDKFVTIRDGDVVMRLDKDEAPVLREYAMALAHQALTTLAARYEFTPRGPILIEIFPKHDDFAVRTARAARHGRRARRLLRPRRHDGLAQGAAARRIPVGGDAVARAGARHHAADVQSARAALADRRDLGLRREAGARRSGAASMDVAFAGMLNRGETLKLKDLNSAFTNPKTISLAYYEASLLVEHIVTAYGDGGLRKLLRAYGQGVDTDAALKTALDTDLDQMQTGFDQTIERMFGAHATALAVPEGAGS